MYEEVVSKIRIKTDGVEADSTNYLVGNGLREGSALAAQLFDIFIDDLIAYIRREEAKGGMTMLRPDARSPATPQRRRGPRQ